MDDPKWVQQGEDGSVNVNPLAYVNKWLTAHIKERRGTASRRVLAEMAA